MQNFDMKEVAARIQNTAESMYPNMVDFLSDLIHIRSYRASDEAEVIALWQAFSKRCASYSLDRLSNPKQPR